MRFMVWGEAYVLLIPRSIVRAVSDLAACMPPCVWYAAAEEHDGAERCRHSRFPARGGRHAQGDPVDVLVLGLDRLGRNLKHLITLLDDLSALGVAFVSLAGGIDATVDT